MEFGVYLCSILLKVCVHLRSRFQEIRDVARNTLVKIIETLGHQYLHYLLNEMQAVLVKGYQVKYCLLLAILWNVIFVYLLLVSYIYLFKCVHSSVLILIIFKKVYRHLKYIVAVGRKPCISKNAILLFRKLKSPKTLYLQRRYFRINQLEWASSHWPMYNFSPQVHVLTFTVYQLLTVLKPSLAAGDLDPCMDMLITVNAAINITLSIITLKQLYSFYQLTLFPDL